ncbi:DNA polymerase III subunit beta [Patescibacteria group bacterium]|nr:DNA polymerase III subunit beta [Patescibacteria group bacterium]
MKLSATQENLNQGLLVVSHVAAKSTSLPILNNILIKAEGGSIKLLSTNLEIGVTCVIRGKVEKDGSFTVQSRLLADYVNLLPKKNVNLEVLEEEDKEGTLNIKCENYSTKIKGASSNDFPLIPEIDKKNPVTVSASELRQAISQTIFAVAASETRPEISGVLLSVAGDQLTLAATDSYRLAEKTIKIKGGKETKVIVPARTMQEILRILSSFKDPSAIENIENVKLYITENQILFVVDNIELISRLVEGQYPDYRQIIPEQNKTKASLDKQELVKATKTASLFTRSGIYDVNLDFSVAGKKLIVSSTNNQLGENISELDAKLEGEENNIVVNYKYLLDGLAVMESDDVALEMNDSSNPCVLKSQDKDYIYIVMPIKQ